MKNTLANICILFLFALLCSKATSAPSCSVNNTPLSFGTVNSYEIYNNAVKTSAHHGLFCRELFALGFLSGDKIDVTSSYSSPVTTLKKIDAPNETIEYKIYADENYTIEFVIGSTFHYGSTSLLNLILGNKNIDIKLYLKTKPGFIVSPGNYQDSINLRWDYDICAGLGVGGLCVGKRLKGTLNSILSITLTVEKHCIIHPITDIVFRPSSLISQFTEEKGSIPITCTKGEDYKVHFTDGNNRLPNSWRRMTDNNGHYLQYHLYQEDGITVLDKLNKISKMGAGTPQSTIVKAIINPSQPELPEGVYVDQVSIVVEY